MTFAVTLAHWLPCYTHPFFKSSSLCPSHIQDLTPGRLHLCPCAQCKGKTSGVSSRAVPVPCRRTSTPRKGFRLRIPQQGGRALQDVSRSDGDSWSCRTQRTARAGTGWLLWWVWLQGGSWLHQEVNVLCETHQGLGLHVGLKAGIPLKQYKLLQLLCVSKDCLWKTCCSKHPSTVK